MATKQAALGIPPALKQISLEQTNVGVVYDAYVVRLHEL